MRANFTQTTLDLLRDYESRNVTFLDPDGTWPIVWERAKGCSVWDTSGRRYLDLTAAFGVAAAGHANPKVVLAGQQQMQRLLHAMGDVHPHALKAELARELSRLTFERWSTRSGGRRPDPGSRARTPCRSQTGDTADWNSELQKGNPGHSAPHGKTVFCNSGFEAVEAALKTAHLATSKAGVLAFEGAYYQARPWLQAEPGREAPASR